jgi:hypothetical protein
VEELTSHLHYHARGRFRWLDTSEEIGVFDRRGRRQDAPRSQRQLSRMEQIEAVVGRVGAWSLEAKGMDADRKECQVREKEW